MIRHQGRYNVPKDVGVMMPADERARKMALYEQFARVGKALANPARLELLDLLAQGERSVEELAETAGMKVSNTSAQLRALASARLVASRRDGVRIYYRLADDNVSAFVGQVLDLRPEAEYAAGHIPGAVNVPHDQLATRLAELPGRADIVAYCRGRYCVFAPDAVRLLRAGRLSARLLEGGLPDWRLAGLPV